MPDDIQQLYQRRLSRYVTAMRNGKPDRVPIRPFAAEFVARYAGYSCQEVTHDYEKAFDATRKCAAEFDWDATVPNMVYVWTGLTKAITLKYYAVPGIEIPPDTAFQYIEPTEEEAHMRADEYDLLIEDPTGYLYNVWLPRVAADVQPIGSEATFRNNLSFARGGMAMMQYFGAFGTQVGRMREESGTVSALCGILKAPFDILADKLRGYKGLVMDLFRQPEKVVAATEALAPHLLHVASTTADPERNLPVGFWMHRACVPFLSPQQFEKFYWPTIKWITEELWKQGIQTLYYAEGDWDPNLDYVATLPERSIVYHCDRGDIFKVHRTLGEKFCISGGVGNELLAFGSPEEVRECVKKTIAGVGRDGGYIVDAAAIMQDDTKPENVRAMTDAAREFGEY